MGVQGDLYKLIQFFTYAGVQAIIRRWYEQLDITGAAPDLAYEWNLAFNAPARDIMSDEVSLDRVEVVNLNNPGDFAIQSQGGVVGVQTSDRLPTFVAFGFEMPSADKRIRAGTCRIPGVTEDAIVDGSLNPTYQTVIDAVADVLALELSSVVGRFEPVLYTPGNNRTLGQPFSIPITTAEFTRITSQNTRKS